MTAATSRIIQRALNASGPWTTIASVTPSVTTYQDTGLTNDTEYFYRVIGVNAEGNSPPSNVASATPSGGLDPDSIPGLVSWLDAGEASSRLDDLGNPVTTSGGLVAEWAEVLASSPGCDSWSAGSTPQSDSMQYEASSINGHPALFFKQANSLQSYSGSPRSFSEVAPGTNELTIFVVASNNTPGALYGLFHSCARTFPTASTFITRAATNRVSITRGTGFSGPTINAASQDDTSNIRLVSHRCSGASATVESWINDTSAGTATQPSQNLYNTNDQGSGIGQYQGATAPSAGAGAWRLAIHEQLVYNRALTDQEAQDVRDYLIAKYGL